MDLNAKELRELIIRPTLTYLGKHSQAAENLLVAIAQINASQDVHPLDNAGTTYGLFKIDVPTHQRVWDKHLAFECDLASKIRGLASQREFLNNPHIELATNLSYSTAIAWSVYMAYPQVRKLPYKKTTASKRLAKIQQSA